jgi:hypothetical protein
VKQVAIAGPAGSGKTTLWRAVTGGRAQGHLAAVPVDDPRLDELVRLHSSRKRVPVQIEVVDVTEIARTQPEAVAKMRQADALLVTLPAFGGLDPEKAFSSFRDDLLLADMAPFETRLERAKKDPAARNEAPALEAALNVLNEGRFLSHKEWERGQLQVFSPMAPLTLKPVVAVFNVDEDGIGRFEPPSLEPEVDRFVACAALEAEAAGLDPEEARSLLSAYGIDQPALDKVIVAIYRSLDLITFFTAGDTESRAWEVTRGATAPEAAGAIHSDIQRGFIRAEVATYEDIVAAGSWDAAKAKGLIRTEGKDYVFAEGDVTHFRFNV